MGPLLWSLATIMTLDKTSDLQDSSNSLLS